MKRFLIAVSLVLIASAAKAEGSIGDVLKQIAQNNLTLKALHHEGEAEVLDMKAANAPGGLSVEYSPFFRSGYSGVAESELVVSQEIQFPTKYADRNKQAKMQKAVGGKVYEKNRRDILLEAQLLCVDVIRLNKTLAMLRQRLRNSETLRQMYDKRMEAGDANILEVNKVKLDCMEVQTLVSEAQNERMLLLQQLAELNGGKPVAIDDVEIPKFQPIADFESYKTLALASDADIQMAETMLQSADMNVKMQKREWLPDISFGYRRNTEQKEAVNGVLVGVSFPLYSNSKNIRAARERRQSAQLQVEQARSTAESQLRSGYQQLVGLQQVLDHSDVKMMQESIELFSKALQQGEINALEYYTEVNSIYEKLQRHIDVHTQSAKLLAALHKSEL